MHVKHFDLFLMPCSAFFATLKFDSLCNVRIANSWSRAPQMCQFGASSFSSTSTLYLPQFIHWRGISWFSKTKSSGRVEQQCTMWGLPLWLHLHILQESSNTNELISYFTELSRSTMAFLRCACQRCNLPPTLRIFYHLAPGEEEKGEE